MMKIIVIDGSDGSGKETQSRLLEKNLKDFGYKVKRVSFPRYNSDSSILVRKYLEGAYGENPDDVSPYRASMFFAVDRLDYFLSETFDNLDVLICDRYTTSNLIHQCSKLEHPQDKEAFKEWLLNLEFKELGLPVPDQVFYLSLPVEITTELIEQRANKSGQKDIHEADILYLDNCIKTAGDLARELDWQVINCESENRIRPVDDIQGEILQKVRQIIDE